MKSQEHLACSTLNFPAFIFPTSVAGPLVLSVKCGEWSVECGEFTYCNLCKMQISSLMTAAILCAIVVSHLAVAVFVAVVASHVVVSIHPLLGLACVHTTTQCCSLQ